MNDWIELSSGWLNLKLVAYVKKGFPDGVDVYNDNGGRIVANLSADDSAKLIAAIKPRSAATVSQAATR